MLLNQKGFFARMSDFLYRNSGAAMGIFLAFFMAGIVSSPAAAVGFYDGDTTEFITKSEFAIKIVRFVAIFIVIGGVIWAGAEFAIKHDQQRGATILVSAVIGGFAVLLAPTLMNFVIGGLGISDITTVGP